MRDRPAILIGQGCRSPKLIEWLSGLSVPILTTWMAMDKIPETHPAFCGRPGVFGQRAANIILQKCDTLYIYGARLDGETVAWNLDNFAPSAIKLVFDVDRAELDKLPDVGWWKYILDISTYVDRFYSAPVSNPEWLSWCKALYKRFRPELETGHAYQFIKWLSDTLTPEDLIILTSSGFAAVSMAQAFQVKEGQRCMFCSTIGAMGVDLPMAIGAAVESGKRTILVTGDGGFMLNVQELEIVKRLKLNIKIFVFNNRGYSSIRHMQDGRFEGRRVGCDRESGLTLPMLDDLCNAFGIEYFGDPQKAMDWNGAALCELRIPPDFKPWPQVVSGMKDGVFQPASLENMTPAIPDLDELMKW